MGIQEPGSPYRYTVEIDYQKPMMLLACWGEIGEESKALWSAYCDEQGKILFGTLGMKNLTDE